MRNKDVKFEILLGKTIIKIDQFGDEQLTFHTSKGELFLMHHSQNCCESVFIDDIVGDLNDLLNTPITLAECVESGGDGPKEKYDNSFTWTFYKLATIKGYVNIKWYGTSNGYYSESVDFQLVIK